jgi:hypothetical protein
VRRGGIAYIPGENKGKQHRGREDSQVEECHPALPLPEAIGTGTHSCGFLGADPPMPTRVTEVAQSRNEARCSGINVRELYQLGKSLHNTLYGFVCGKLRTHVENSVLILVLSIE